MAEQEPGSVYGATVWKRLEKKSTDVYVAGIKRYLGVFRRHPNLGIQGALEETLLQTVRTGPYEGPIKKVLSRLRIVEKAGRIPKIVQAGDWQIVKAMENLRARRMGVQVR